MAKKKTAAAAAEKKQSPHFLQRDYHHGLGGGLGGNGDGEKKYPIENLVLPRRIPDKLKRDYVRKRARGAGAGAGGAGAGDQQQRDHYDTFGPPHLLGGGGAQYTMQHRKDMAARAGAAGTAATDPDGAYNHVHRNRTHAAGDGPWQLSLIFIFAIIAVLAFLLLSLLGAEPKPRRNKAGPNAGLARAQRRRMSSFTTKRKKTDAWSGDDEMSDQHSNASCDNVDGNDSSSSGMGITAQEGIAGAPPQGPFGYFPQGPQQQHRQRKPTSAAVPPPSDVIMSGSSHVGVVASPSAAAAGKPKYRRSPSNRTHGQHPSPALASPPKAAVSPLVTKLTFDIRKNASPGVPAPPPPAGLEGFQSPQRNQQMQHQQAKAPAIPAPPLLSGTTGTITDNQLLVTPARRPPAVSDRQVSMDLESGHPSEAEEEEDETFVPLEDGPAAGEDAVTGPAQKLGDSSPFQSFGSIPSPLLVDKKDVTEGKPSVLGAAGVGPPPRLDMSSIQQSYRNVPQVGRAESFESPQVPRHRGVTSLTSPKLAVQLGHDDIEAATPIVANKRRIHLTKDPSHSFDGSEGPSRPPSNVGQGVPFMPNIYEDMTESSIVGPTPLLAPYGDAGDEMTANAGLSLQPTSRTLAAMSIPEFAQAPSTDSGGVGSGSSSRASMHVSAPHSVPIDDLHLIRMESGHGDSYGGKWTANTSSDGSFDFARAPSHGPILPEPKVFEHSYRRQETPLHANIAQGPGRTHGQIAAAVLQERSRSREGGKESQDEAGGNEIKHKRTDLTTWSDSAASLTSPIDFTEIKLLSVIGGGGFGQVWMANWRGTPVAVKLLSMSAQTDNVPKKVLQEFVSEINMLSGMRHPNVSHHVHSPFFIYGRRKLFSLTPRLFLSTFTSLDLLVYGGVSCSSEPSHCDRACSSWQRVGCT